MLGWALTFLIVALIAAVLGFGGIAGVSIEIAKIIFFVGGIVPDLRARRNLPRAHTDSPVAATLSEQLTSPGHKPGDFS